MKTSKKIVVKVGTSTLTQGSKTLSREYMLELTRQLAHIHGCNHQVVLVTSGAVAAGRDLLSHASIQQHSPEKQVFSAIGQAQLMEIWKHMFSLFDIHVGQVLLTKDDFSDRKRHLNTSQTLSSLMHHKVVPIINENDAITTSDNRVGDNDNLASMVASSIGADLLILLTDQQGLYTADPRIHPDAKLISVVTHIDEEIFSYARGTSSNLGTGGMTTKLEAAQRASLSGTRTVIASSNHQNVIVDISEGKPIGTSFLAKTAAYTVETKHLTPKKEEKAMSMEEMAVAAKQASHKMARIPTEKKNETLRNIVAVLHQRRKEILEANVKDIEKAKAAHLSDAMIDRLSIQNRLDGIIADVEQVIRLPDPIGEPFEEQIQGELKIKKCRTPLGVLGVIYESRPNITIDISALTIKSGNCAILRGGTESLQTNKILVECIQEALERTDIPKQTIQLVQTSDRGEVHKMLRLHDSIDLIIPRGGASLHKFCQENSTIPVITGGVGVCHLFVDESADLEKSIPVIINAKTQRPTVCNALDTLLVHEKVADVFIPRIVEQLAHMGVRFRLDERSLQVVEKNHVGAVVCSGTC